MKTKSNLFFLFYFCVILQAKKNAAIRACITMQGNA